MAIIPNLQLPADILQRSGHYASASLRQLGRRAFLKQGAGAASAALLVSCDLLEPVEPVEQNPPSTSPGVTTVGVSIDRVIQQAAIQECQNWCWAASASMIFGFLGRHVTQTTIVARTIDAPACSKANTAQIIQSLSGQYVDSSGRPFTSQVAAAYDFFSGIYNLSNAGIVQLLKAGRPLLYCNKGHAMVLHELTYLGSERNPNVQTARVIDPWPTNSRTRMLTSAEMFAANLGGDMTFLAGVQIF